MTPCDVVSLSRQAYIKKISFSEEEEAFLHLLRGSLGGGLLRLHHTASDLLTSGETARASLRGLHLLR